SPDGKFMATMTIANEVKICQLTNGLPDIATLLTILNLSTVGNARGIAFDAADNLLVQSSGQGLIRYYSLGNTSTCISSNDASGVNGSFTVALPPVSASILTTANASQNYINSAPPGVPNPGVFNIRLNTNNLTSSIKVSFAKAGTAVYPTHYAINTG